MKNKKTIQDHTTGLEKASHKPAQHQNKKATNDVDEHADRNDEYNDFNKRTGVEKVEPVMEESHKTAHE